MQRPWGMKQLDGLMDLKRSPSGLSERAQRAWRGLCELKQEHAKSGFLVNYWVSWRRPKDRKRRTVVAEAGRDGTEGGLMGREMRKRGEKVLLAGHWAVCSDVTPSGTSENGFPWPR